VKLAGALVAVALLAACGSGDKDERVAVRVQSELVPPTLGDGALRLKEDVTAHKAFGKVGGQSLVDDGRLWAVRDGDQLVATLQMATLDAKVDLGDEDEVEGLIRSILPGTKERFTVGDLPVVQVATADKTVYLWFGDGMFQVFQIKGADIEPEMLLGELIAFQTSSPAWTPPPTLDEG
jgi:hypothetical protein